MKLALLLLPFVAFCQDPQQPLPKATLEGTVVNAAGGEPRRKARVTLRVNVGPTRQMTGQAAVTMNQSVTSDPSGKFYFPSVDPGDYQLIVRRDGFASRTIGGMTEGSNREPVVLGPGDHKSGLVVKLVPYAVVSGRAVDEDGDPMYLYCIKATGRACRERSASKAGPSEKKAVELKVTTNLTPQP